MNAVSVCMWFRQYIPDGFATIPEQVLRLFERMRRADFS